jgi:zinc protease
MKKETAHSRRGSARPLALAIALCIASALALSCAGGQAASQGGSAGGFAPNSGDREYAAFVEANKGSVAQAALSNGIKVVLKRSSANKVLSVKVYFDGGTAMTPKAKAGLDGITLAMMARGSKSVGYDELQSRLYRDSAAIYGESANFDWSDFALGTLGKYSPELLPLFLDCLCDPAFSEADFKTVMNQATLALQNTLSDPWNAATAILHSSFFAGHPYEADFQGSLESLASITLDDVKANYARLMAGGRVTVVVVGDIAMDQILPPLEKGLGSLKKGSSVPAVQALRERPLFLSEPFEDSEGVAYVRGDFPFPAVGSKDYYALSLGFSILDDVLMDVVRVKNGACYSVWANSRGGRAPYGSIGVYKTAKPWAIKALLDESVGVILGGKSMGIGEDSDRYEDIDSTLPFYKSKFVFGFFEQQQTNASIADQLASSGFLAGDPLDYLGFAARVNSITKADIVSAFQRYVAKAKVAWIALGDPALLKKVDGAAYSAPFAK